MSEPEEHTLLSESKTEAALAGLHRSIAASQFYPPNHPMLVDALNDGYRSWGEAGQDSRWEEPGFRLRAGALWLGEVRLGATNPPLTTLARTFSAHGLASLRCPSALPREGYDHLVSLLAAAPDALLPQGGLPALWKQGAYAAHLELQALAVTSADGATASVDASPARESGCDHGLTAMNQEVMALSDPLLLGRLQAFKQRSPREQRLLDLLLRLGGTEDINAFLAILREITRYVESFLETERFRDSFHVVLYLYREAQSLDALGQEGRRDYLMETVRLLLRGDFLQWLIAHVITAPGDEEAEVGEYILRALGKEVVVPLLNALMVEKSRGGRRRLVEVLVSTGDAAIPWAVRLLEDQRWYVVRNMITILGGVGSPEAVKALLRVAGDADARLRKEVARALGRASGAAVEAQLIRYLDDPDPSVRLMAASVAGTQRSPTMLQALCRSYRRIGLRSAHWNLKGILLQAIGRTGLPEGADLLARVVRRRPLLWPKRWHAIQRAAILALGHLGGDRAQTLLESLRNHRSPELRQAVLRALAAVEGQARGSAS